MTLGAISRWDSILDINNNIFFTDQCVVVFPLYFGYEFQTPFASDDENSPQQYKYDPDCEDELGGAQPTAIPTFTGQYYKTADPGDQDFQDRYQPTYSSNDVQIMAILQGLAAVLGEDSQLGLDLNGNVGILGGSMGANTLYDLAPIMYANGAPGSIKVCVACYGGTDQFAPFNVRRAKRYLASRIKRRKNVPGVGMMLANEFTYKDITDNQIARATSDGVKLYVCQKDPSLGCLDDSIAPPSLSELSEALRRWLLEDSVARLWDYQNGPYPLQVHQGTYDPTVLFYNSRWFAEQMRQNGVPFDSDNFEYYETPFAIHDIVSLGETSHAAMATVLSVELGW